MNNLSVDTKTISKAVDKTVSFEQAKGYLTDAGVIHEIDLKKYRSEADGGVYLAQDAHGFIATEAMLTYQTQKRMRTRINELLDSHLKKDRIMGMRLVRNLVEDEVELGAHLLKMCEIVSARNTMIAEHAKAPAFTTGSPDMRISGCNVQIQIKPPETPVEKKVG